MIRAIFIGHALSVSHQITGYSLSQLPQQKGHSLSTISFIIGHDLSKSKNRGKIGRLNWRSCSSTRCAKFSPWHIQHTLRSDLAVSDLGKLIRERRQDRKWSLHQLGEKIGVTPAYVADLEAGRRSPGVELKERIAAALDISPENLAAADARLSADLRDWIEERPPLTAVLRFLHTSPNSDRLIQRLGRFISRRSNGLTDGFGHSACKPLI